MDATLEPWMSHNLRVEMIATRCLVTLLCLWHVLLPCSGYLKEDAVEKDPGRLRRRLKGSKSSKSFISLAPTVAPTLAPTAPNAAPTSAPTLEPRCKVLHVQFLSTEISAGVLTGYPNARGLDSVPFYDPETGEQLGVQSEFATKLPSGECLGTGTYNFALIPGRGVFASQIHTSFACKGDDNSVIGGNGEYECVTGREFFGSAVNGILDVYLNLCNAGCPF